MAYSGLYLPYFTERLIIIVQYVNKLSYEQRLLEFYATKDMKRLSLVRRYALTNIFFFFVKEFTPRRECAEFGRLRAAI